MNWIDPNKELPKPGQRIALLIPSCLSGSNIWPYDYEIIFGMTKYLIKNGRKTLSLECNFIGDMAIVEGVAWCYAKEFEKLGLLRDER